MKKIYTITSLVIACLALFLFCNTSHVIRKTEQRKSTYGEADEAAGRTEWETKRLADPATGKIPPHIRMEELQFASTLPKITTSTNANARSRSTFDYRGPINVGGRTRALAIDITNENNILAGSVNGGIWRSTDGGITWNKVWTSVNQAITWISQDKRNGQTGTWYCSTGEPIGASSSGNGSNGYYLGNGVYKSTDGGVTWNVLGNTSSGTPHTFDNVWDLIYKVVPDQHDSVSSIVYAASYGAIYRSINGGSSWTLSKGNNSGAAFSYYTDVDVTPTGIVYATLSSDGPNKGVWRRDLANAWTKISPVGWDTGTVNRVVIAINPSNENEVYFLGETPFMGKMTTNFKGDPEWTSLLKYTYVSGNGTGAGGVWDDLSPNIPYDGSQFGNFNSQGGYDLVIRIHPTQPNIVFIGGTNLYRSTDGFTTSTQTTAIGGYDITSTLPHYVNYLNHHSDQHNLVFLPSNPNVVYQANDGGIYKSNDIQSTTVVWQDLNTGYNTAQFYTVAIDHATTGNDLIMGGTQDNGTWLTNTQNVAIPWTQPGRGDGAFCAIDNGHGNYYTSRQQGRLMKSTLDANGNTLGFNRIDPLDTGDYLFINPFTLDPNNNDIMYWAAENRIWRNDSLTTLPLTGNWDSIPNGWFLFPDTINHAGAIVTSFGVSTTPANRLYIGTDQRYLYRCDNANSATPVLTEITDAVNFPASSYINCIAVDPNNADNVIIVFSNYKIYSLFYSTNGGTTWTKGAGNLEGLNQAGPSLRWASIIPTTSGYVYLVGASTGLYGTNFLNGVNTIWSQLASNEIGNLVVDMMDFRTSDGMVAIATHGGGMFSTTITDTLLTGINNLDNKTAEINVFPNPSSGKINIEYTVSKNEQTSIIITDHAGKIIDKIEGGKQNNGKHSVEYSTAGLSPGIYFVKVDCEKKSLVKKILVLDR